MSPLVTSRARVRYHIQLTPKKLLGLVRLVVIIKLRQSRGKLKFLLTVVLISKKGGIFIFQLGIKALMLLVGLIEVGHVVIVELPS